MLSCDFNGWSDVPEDEREALDVYEAAVEKARVAVGSGGCPPLPATQIPPERGGRSLIP